MQYGMPYGIMDGYGTGYGMEILGLIFWILVIIGLVLKRRYARGDISKEEFEEKKKELL